MADRDFKISKIKHFHTSTKPDIALAEYFATFPNEIQQVFGRRPSLRNQHVLYRNPSTKDIRIEIKIEQFDISSIIIILTHNNHFQGIPKNLRKTLNYINDFHKLSLATSKQEWRDFKRAVKLELFPKVASDSDPWNGFAKNINFIGQVAENLDQNERDVWQRRKDKIVSLGENELLRNFFQELIKFQCQNPASDAAFEKFFKVKLRPVEQLIIDFSFSVREPNGDVVSNRLLKDFLGLDDPLTQKIANYFTISMAQWTQSKKLKVTPINAEFMLLQNNSSLHNHIFCDLIIPAEVRDALEDFENRYSTLSMRLWETLKQRLVSRVSKIWNMDIELIRIGWKMNPMNITLRLSKSNGENITGKEKEEVNDILNKNVFRGLANFNFLAEGRNDTTQVISRFRSTFQLKMFRSFGYMKGHGVMLCQLMNGQLQDQETFGIWCKNDAMQYFRVIAVRTFTCFILYKDMSFCVLLN